MGFLPNVLCSSGLRPWSSPSYHKVLQITHKSTISKFLHSLTPIDPPFRALGQDLHKLLILLLIIEHQDTRKSPKSDLPFPDQFFNETDYDVPTVESVPVYVFHVRFEILFCV